MAKGGAATVLAVLAAATLLRLEHLAKNDGVGEKLDIDFVVSTGVNFYDMDIYRANSLQKPWYLAYCVIAIESAGRQIPMVFLGMIKEDFNKRYAGGKAATATANSLTRDFGLRLRDQMQYCTDHPEEVSKLSKVKAQVEQVKSIMMENIDKARSAIVWTISCLLDAEKILVESCFAQTLLNICHGDHCQSATKTLI
ncbi:unnamed protein product [Miscanthus lutarioriparius]|uniref:Longin domain-containing protein n=1 Tax=Miscanthus lutarioriparius TaxID=422564 RepID=A0A811P3K8_9POAL|nr:unnamed protein product [Miscanthus lutarioriparius]